MSDTVSQIKEKLSIVDVVSGYVALQRSGGTLKARCPFHAEKTPSFTVSPERGTYHCFGCGVGGDMFTFIQEIEGVDFKGALKILADKAGVEIVYAQGNREEKDAAGRLFELMEAATLFYQTKLDKPAEEYLAGRGLKPETVRAFRLGLAGNGWTDASDYLKSKKFTDGEIIEAGMAKKNERGGLLDKFRNRILFPVSDTAGRVIAFSGRSFGEHASPEAPKYLNSPETPLYHKSSVLYGFDKAKVEMRKLGCAVLVEGQMDLVMSHQAAWSNAVAVSGTAFTDEHAKLIKRMTDNLVIALDADPAGIKAAGKASRAALAAGLNVKVAQLPEGSDPADLILKEGKEAWSASIRDSKDIIAFLLDVLERHAKSADIFRRSVESVVLPFLQDVQSPIAKEQYVAEIAKRLSVSDSSVVAAMAQVPVAAALKHAGEHAQAPATVQAPKASSRAKQALSILLWQQSVKAPAIDVRKAELGFIDAVGIDAYGAMLKESEGELEKLRFAAEHLHGIGDLALTFSTLLRVMQADRLSEELSRATRELERAEATADDAAAERLMDECKLLTAKIAQLHAVG